MNRIEFIASGVAAGVALFQQEQYDPASSSAAPSLRVLLGTAPASIIDANTFLYDNRKYRGTFTILPDGSILSTVPLEAYLYSVVSREMSPSWPAAALQAQAIAARTYVLQRSDPKRAYDVVTSEADQVYGGIASEWAASSAAVDATAGEVLRFGQGYAQLFYSSCCGGHTESSADAWAGGATLPYLQSVADPWCTQSPDYTWSREISGDQITRAFPSAAIGNPTGLALGATDPSGRARQITITGDAGSTTVTGTAFRAAVGTRIVRSLLIHRIGPGAGPESFVIEGGGLGHGVGMCQWGAKGMAAAGKSADDILNFYFPGTQRGHD